MRSPRGRRRCGCRAAGLLDVVRVERDLLVEAADLGVERDALVHVGLDPAEDAHRVEVLRVRAEAHHSSVLLRDDCVDLALKGESERYKMVPLNNSIDRLLHLLDHADHQLLCLDRRLESDSSRQLGEAERDEGLCETLHARLDLRMQHLDSTYRLKKSHSGLNLAH